MVLEDVNISDRREVWELEEGSKQAHRNATELRREADRWDRLGTNLYNEAMKKSTKETCPVHTGMPEPCPDCEAKIAGGQ